MGSSAPRISRAAFRHRLAHSRVWRKIRVPVLVILLPVLAPLSAAQALADRERRERQRAAAARRAAVGLQAGRDLGGWLFLAACVMIPGIAVAAWYVIQAVHLPPYGRAGPLVGLLLAAVFGIQNIVTLYMLAFRFSHDSGLATRPIRYLVKNSMYIIRVFCLVNAPLTLCLAVVHALT